MQINFLAQEKVLTYLLMVTCARTFSYVLLIIELVDAQYAKVLIPKSLGNHQSRLSFPSEPNPPQFGISGFGFLERTGVELFLLP